MKKIIQNILCIKIIFILGIGFGYQVFEKKIHLKIPMLLVRTCNETDINIASIEVFEGPNFSDIQSGECSGYKYSGALMNHIAMSVITGESEDRESYRHTLMDDVGVPYLNMGKYTISINKLMPTVRKTTQYENSIDYKLKKDGPYEEYYNF